MVNSPVWNVSLFPVVQQALSYIHENYYRNLDMFVSGESQIPPSSIACYKEYLRKELATAIAETKPRDPVDIILKI